MIPLGVLGAAHRVAGGGGVDPHWANVASLLHFNGTDGSTSFPDSTGKTWTRTANGPLIKTANSRFGGASGSFGSAAGGGFTGCIKTSPSADFNFGTGDFTIDFWHYFTGLPGRGYVYSCGGNNAALIINPVTGLVEVYGPASYVINAGSTPFTALTWTFCRFKRTGNLWEFQRNGTTYVSATDTRSWGDSSSDVRLGNLADSAGQPMTGWLDEFRVTKGIARTDGVPSAPFPDS